MHRVCVKSNLLLFAVIWYDIHRAKVLKYPVQYRENVQNRNMLFEKGEIITLKKIPVLLFLALLLVMTGCSGESDQGESPVDPPADTVGNPVVTLEMDNGSEIIIELYPDTAPNTVQNFVCLVEQGYYDGLTFHRIVPGFVIQGGCPLGSGTGGPGWTIRGEFAENGFENPLEHQRGVVSMARRGDHFDTAGSQFFIVVGDASFLDGAYAAFGQVLEGMEEVDAIVGAAAAGQQPLEPRIILRASVELNNWQAAEPEKLK